MKYSGPERRIHDCIQAERIEGMEYVTRKAIIWEQGIAVVGGAFGICCMGFMLLHGMITADKIYAAEQLEASKVERNARINRLEDSIAALRMDNEKQFRDIMSVLLRISK